MAKKSVCKLPTMTADYGRDEDMAMIPALILADGTQEAFDGSPCLKHRLGTSSTRDKMADPSPGTAGKSKRLHRYSTVSKGGERLPRRAEAEIMRT